MSKKKKTFSKPSALVGGAIVALVVWIVGSSFWGNPFAAKDFNVEEQAAVKKISKEIKGATQKDEFQLYMEKEGKKDNEVNQPLPFSKDGLVVLATGSVRTTGFVGGGTLRLLELLPYEDQIVRFENMDMLNGPDLHVYLVRETNIEKFKDIEEFIDLGEVRGNVGSHNYNIPTSVDAREYGSFVIVSQKYEAVFASANLDVHDADGGILQANKSDVMGDWVVVTSEDLGWQSVSFMEDGTYNTHLNDRPFDDGTWTLENGELKLESSVPSMSATFRKARTQVQRLIMEGNTGLSILKRPE